MRRSRCGTVQCGISFLRNGRISCFLANCFSRAAQWVFVITPTPQSCTKHKIQFPCTMMLCDWSLKIQKKWQKRVFYQLKRLTWPCSAFLNVRGSSVSKVISWIRLVPSLERTCNFTLKKKKTIAFFPNWVQQWVVCALWDFSKVLELTKGKFTNKFTPGVGEGKRSLHQTSPLCCFNFNFYPDGSKEWFFNLPTWNSLWQTIGGWFGQFVQISKSSSCWRLVCSSSQGNKNVLRSCRCRGEASIFHCKAHQVAAGMKQPDIWYLRLVIPDLLGHFSKT